MVTLHHLQSIHAFHYELPSVISPTPKKQGTIISSITICTCTRKTSLSNCQGYNFFACCPYNGSHRSAMQKLATPSLWIQSEEFSFNKLLKPRPKGAGFCAATLICVAETPQHVLYFVFGTRASQNMPGVVSYFRRFWQGRIWQC